MDRLASVVVPVLVAFGASIWLYGKPGRTQRREAPFPRRHSVLALAGVSAALAVLAFFTRAQWVGSTIPSGTAVSVFLGLILLTVALLYAAVPPQRGL